MEEENSNIEGHNWDFIKIGDSNKLQFICLLCNTEGESVELDSKIYVKKPNLRDKKCLDIFEEEITKQELTSNDEVNNG